MIIENFKEDYFFLSNFFPCPIPYEGITYQSSEAAYQAAKCLDPQDRLQFQYLSAGKAKHLGQRVMLRPDWEEVKQEVMWNILMIKFCQVPQMARLLLQTGDEELREENNWGDRYWGTVKGEGENHLGLMLMSLREIILEFVTEMNKYQRLMQELVEKKQGKMRCFGGSMLPVLKSGSLMTFVTDTKYEIGDYVFCKVKGNWIDCHVVKAKNPRRGYLISNMDGFENGWTKTLYGKAVQAELGGRVYWKA